MNGNQPWVHIFIRLIKFKLVVTEIDTNYGFVLNEHYNSEISMVVDAVDPTKFTYDSVITTPTVLNRNNIQITYSPIQYVNVKDADNPHVIVPDRPTYKTNPAGRPLEVACSQIRVSPPSA